MAKAEETTFQQLQTQVAEQDSRVDESLVRLRVFEQNQTLERQGRLQVFELRATWSRYLVTLLAATILFQIVLAFGIGMGLFDFSNYQASLDIIVGSNFVQIVGLITIALTFLFSEASRTGDR